MVVKKSLNLPLSKLDLYGPDGEAVLEKVSIAVNAIKSSKSKCAAVAALKKHLKKCPKNRGKQRVFQSCVPMLNSVTKQYSKVRCIS